MADKNWFITYSKSFQFRRFLVYIASYLICPILIAQSPWLYTRHQGFYQVQTTFLAFPYSAVIDGRTLESRVDINREVYTADVSLYFEHGLSDSWNLIGKIPFRYASSGDQVDELHYQVLLPEGTITGLSNLEFALKRKLIDRKIKIAATLRAIINTTSANLEKGLITGYKYNALGLFGHIGGSMGEKLYVFTDLGYVTTSNDFSDYFNQHIEAAYYLGRVFWLRLTVDVRMSMKNGSYDNQTLIQTGLSPNDQGWVGYGFGLTYETKNRVGFDFSMGGAIQATYVGYAAPLTIGIYKKV